MKVDIRPMTQMEYNDFQDYLEEMQDKGFKETKIVRKLVNWVCENVYKMDLNDKESTPAVCMYIFNKTTEITNDMNEEEIKNLMKSGIGESVAE